MTENLRLPAAFPGSLDAESGHARLERLCLLSLLGDLVLLNEVPEESHSGHLNQRNGKKYGRNAIARVLDAVATKSSLDDIMSPSILQV